MHVFLSFTGTLRAIRDNQLSAGDLSKGFYYFNAARSGVMTLLGVFLDGDELPPEREFLRGSYEKYTAEMAVLRPHLERAEEELRVLWANRENEKSLETLLSVLRAQGESIPDAPMPDTEGDDRYWGSPNDVIAKWLELELGWTAIT